MLLFIDSHHFVEFFLVNSTLFFIFYAVSYDGSVLYSQPTLIKPAISSSVFSLIIMACAKVLCGALPCSLFFSTLAGSSFFTLLFEALLLFSCILVLLVTKDFLNFRGIYRYEYAVFFSFSVFGLLLLVSANDFLTVYLAIELQGLCFYLLATFQRESEFSAEAGLKYFILGSFSSGLLLFGFLLLYLSSGTTSLECLAKTLTTVSSSTLVSFLGLFFVVVSLFFKVGAAPFHMWLCDVYEGCLTSVSALFATTPKIALFSILFKLYLGVFYGYLELSAPFFMFCGALSVLFSAVGGLYQKRVKRLIAYSAISHTGFVLLGLLPACAEAASSCFIYVTAYVLTSFSIFSVLILVGVNKKAPKYLIN